MCFTSKVFAMICSALVLSYNWFKHLRFKMTNTTKFRNAVFGLKALFLDDNPPSLRKCFSLAKRAFFTQEMLFSC